MFRPDRRTCCLGVATGGTCMTVSRIAKRIRNSSPTSHMSSCVTRLMSSLRPVPAWRLLETRVWWLVCTAALRGWGGAVVFVTTEIVLFFVLPNETSRDKRLVRS